MENILTFLNLKLDFINIGAEKIKLIVFMWNLLKCTILLAICLKLFKWICERLFKQVVSHLEAQERIQQFLTLKAIILHTGQAVFLTIYAMNMLFLCGIDVRPLLATAGVLGVAIGFGAKRSVEDIISGIIIILQGQIRVGDYVEIQGMSGFVEKITLPLITIRSEKNGAVYFVRCGSVDNLTNFTMQYSYAFLSIDVAYKENIDHVFKTLKKCYDILAENVEYNKYILGDLEIFGLDEFKESSICIKCRIKTQPKEQWIIKRLFNKIVKEQFDTEKIEIPFNQLVVTNTQA